MAIYHLAVKHASRRQGRSALAHATYIAREGPYAHGRFVEEFVQVEHRNMPTWAQTHPQAFWAAADTHERANGRLYTELEIALPRELSRPEQAALARSFIDHQIGRAHPCSWAFHVSHALDGGEQPHVHVMFSERTHDGIDRGPALFFKRAHPTDPALGGAAKDPAWNHRDKVEALREAWTETANRALERAGLASRIDHRSLAAQGIDRLPEPKLGPERTAMLRRGLETPESAQVLDLRAYRARLERVEQAVERTQGQVIDFTQARTEREARERAQVERQAQEQAREREAQARAVGGETPGQPLRDRLSPAEAARVERVLAQEPAWRAAQDAVRIERLIARLENPEARVEALLQRADAWHTAHLEQARQQLEHATGQAHTFAEAVQITGRLVDRVDLAGNDFGRVLDREGHMVLVPWTREMAPHLERSVAIQIDAARQVTRVLAEAPQRDRDVGLDRGG